MTEHERPVGTPGNPTPEEISARLEALLKRTHTLRAERSSQAASSSLDITWPPPERELDHYDVVDVAPGGSATPPPTTKPADATPPPQKAAASTTREPSAEFARPDWSELRLRSTPDDRGGRSSWLWAATILLALAAVGQAAYILYLHTAHPAQVSGRLRVDGPEGAQVRVNGRDIGVAPVDHALEPGGYTVEVLHDNVIATASSVVIGLGRTVVVAQPTLAPATAGTAATTSAAVAPPVTAAAPTVLPRTSAASPTSPARATASGPVVTATLGAVTIESVPPGVPVTMEGRPRGVTPVTIPLLKPGRHDVMVGRYFTKVDVLPNEVTTLRVP